MVDYKFGLTKVELLVAFVCLGVLIGLLMPAVGSRPAARRVECAARLGELIKSFQLYEMAQQKYPGTLNAFAKDDEGMVKVGTWAISIMPYIGQEPLYDIWADPSTTGPWNRRGGGASAANEDYFPKVNLFVCGADPNLGDLRAPCSFAVNAGFFPEPLPPGYTGLNAHEIARRSSNPANAPFSNQLPAETNCVYTKYAAMRVLGSRADAPTRATDIRDGLTNTIALAESINADSWSQVGHDSGWDTIEIDGVTYAGDDLNSKWSPRVRLGFVWQFKAQPPVAGVPNYVAPKRAMITTKRDFSPELARPSSYHTGLFNAAMMGGSVMTIDNAIDYRVLQALMTPQTKSSDVPDRKYVLKEDDYE